MTLLQRMASTRTLLFFFAVSALLPCLAAPLAAQEKHLEILGGKLQAELERIVDEYEGVAGVHLLDLSSGDRFGVNDELSFPQASAIKVPILLELFRRAESEPGLLRRRVDITDEVRTGGSGVLRHLTDGGATLSLEDHAIYMIVYSDNTATNVLIDALGMDAINALSASLGAGRTRLARKMQRPEASVRGDENLSTPRDAALIMERIASCDLPMSKAGCARVREILEIYKGGPIRTPVPRQVPIAFKPGGITGVSTVWGLVDVPDRPYVISVMSTLVGLRRKSVTGSASCRTDGSSRHCSCCCCSRAPGSPPTSPIPGCRSWRATVTARRSRACCSRTA